MGNLQLHLWRQPGPDSLPGVCRLHITTLQVSCLSASSPLREPRDDDPLMRFPSLWFHVSSRLLDAPDERIVAVALEGLDNIARKSLETSAPQSPDCASELPTEGENDPSEDDTYSSRRALNLTSTLASVGRALSPGGNRRRMPQHQHDRRFPSGPEVTGDETSARREARDSPRPEPSPKHKDMLRCYFGPGIEHVESLLDHANDDIKYRAERILEQFNACVGSSVRDHSQLDPELAHKVHVGGMMASAATRVAAGAGTDG